MVSFHQKASLSWSPTEVLQMVNPDKCSETQWTCPVQSLKKKRCLVARDAKSYIGARFILSEMSIEDPVTFLNDQDKLVELAKLTLCMKSHLNGYRQIPGRKEKLSCVELAVSEWRALISNYISKENVRSERPKAGATTPNLTSTPRTLRFIEEGLVTPAPSVTSEASSVPGAHRPSQRGGRAESRPSSIKLEKVDFPRVPRESSTGRQHARPSSRISRQAGGSSQNGPVGGQSSMNALLQALKDMAIEKERVEAENSLLWKEKEAMQQEVVRAERDCQAIKEHRNNLADQVDQLYEEINELEERLEYHEGN